MTTRAILLTGNELRHHYMASRLASTPEVALAKIVHEEAPGGLKVDADATRGAMAARHLAARRQSEIDFFSESVALLEPPSSAITLPRGEVNARHMIAELAALEADLVIAFGCSLICDDLIDAYRGRFINLHLGLSPYYRGSATNFWAMADGRLECVGATVMHIDSGIDTGSIIHQLRARVVLGDGPHSIGNRLIRDLAEVVAALCAVPVEEMHGQVPDHGSGRLCRRRDFDEQAVAACYRRFEDGMVDAHLERQADREAEVPLIRHPGLAGLPCGR